MIGDRLINLLEKFGIAALAYGKLNQNLDLKLTATRQSTHTPTETKDDYLVLRLALTKGGVGGLELSCLSIIVHIDDQSAHAVFATGINNESIEAQRITDNTRALAASINNATGINPQSKKIKNRIAAANAALLLLESLWSSINWRDGTKHKNRLQFVPGDTTAYEAWCKVTQDQPVLVKVRLLMSRKVFGVGLDWFAEPDWTASVVSLPLPPKTEDPTE